MTAFFRTGSFGNGTSVKGFSDVDYFAEFPTAQLSSSSDYSLQKIRRVLDTRFPDTGVTVRSPAVVVPFGKDGSETTEIVPADYLRTVGGGRYRLYDIPDRNAGWMNAVPDAHNAYVGRIDEAHGRKAKGLIRLAKAWKYLRSVPVLSFYLEMRAAKYASDESTIVYGIDLKRFLGQLLSAKLSSMQDPTGYTGLIHSCASDIQWQDAMSKLETAYVRAEKAVAAEVTGNIAKAFAWWDLVFAGQFPAYY
jgi:hypothetical protein